MELTSYVKPSSDIDLINYLKSQKYDIWGGGSISYVEDSPSHIEHGSIRVNGDVIFFNYADAILSRSFKTRTWPWNYSGYTIDMWIKPISYWGYYPGLISIKNDKDRMNMANWDYCRLVANMHGTEQWVGYNGMPLNNVNNKGVPNNKWSRLTICSDEDNKILYVFVNGELQVTVSGGGWRIPSFYMGGQDSWNGCGYCQLYLNEIYVTPKVRFTEEFDPYKNWMSDDHSIYTNQNTYGILKKDDDK